MLNYHTCLVMLMLILNISAECLQVFLQKYLTPNIRKQSDYLINDHSEGLCLHINIVLTQEEITSIIYFPITITM